MRSALIWLSPFPLTMMVYVSSFSVDMRLPNHERFVSSGEDSGVGLTSSATGNEKEIQNWQVLLVLRQMS